MSSRIVMKIYDEDKISDEIVGSLLFNIKECIGPLVNTPPSLIIIFICLEWKILLEKHIWLSPGMLR
jgi:hypothetical protein